MKAFNLIDNFFLVIANTFLLAMTLCITFDAAFRYLFNSPISGIYELVEYFLMVGIVFFGLSSTLKAGQHISVDMITKKFSVKKRLMIRIISHTLSLIFFSVMTWQTTLSTINAWEVKEILYGSITLPLYPAYLMVPIGTLLLSIRLFLEIIETVKEYISSNEILS